MTHTVELRKPTPEENTRRYDGKLRTYVGESFDAGERIIMVDGLRWGRTFVTRHGVHGTKHVFKQDEGDVICEEKRDRYTEIAVRSHRRHWLKGSDWRPTLDMVLEKAKELVEAKKLRHPDVVKRENQRAMERYRERRATLETQRAKAFRDKAMEALQVNDPDSAIIDRVVAAMQWAQTQ